MTANPSEILSSWQLERLRTVHDGRREYGKGRDDVTVLAYYWGADAEKPDTQFYRVESAFRETYLYCGMMRSVIVTDRPTKEVERFAETFPSVEIQIEKSLVPGNLDSMSRDCDGKFAERFQTEYLMVIQDDGFPLRKGIDEFLGPWDFIGAPYVRDKFIPRLAAKILNLWISNGGFSIRTHRMCEMAAKCYREKWRDSPDCHEIGEDAFYTETLLKTNWRYNRTMRMADNRSALKFAWDKIVPQPIKSLPFGFHRASTFVDFLSRGWIEGAPSGLKKEVFRHNA